MNERGLLASAIVLPLAAGSLAMVAMPDLQADQVTEVATHELLTIIWLRGAAAAGLASAFGFVAYVLLRRRPRPRWAIELVVIGVVGLGFATLHWTGSVGSASKILRAFDLEPVFELGGWAEAPRTSPMQRTFQNSENGQQLTLLRFDPSGRAPTPCLQDVVEFASGALHHTRDQPLRPGEYSCPPPTETVTCRIRVSPDPARGEIEIGIKGCPKSGIVVYFLSSPDVAHSEITRQIGCRG